MGRIILSFFSVICFLILFSTASASIKINEFYSAGNSSDPDWVEIYLENDNIALYQLNDSSNNIKLLSTAICNGNFCTIDWSNRLNNDGDTIKLSSTSSAEIAIDEITYGNSQNIPILETGQSAGRRTDGTGEWVIFSSPSKGSSNNSSIPITPTNTPIPTPTPTPTETPNPTSTSTPTPTKTPTPVKTPTPTKVPTVKPSPKISPTVPQKQSGNSNIPASILGTSSAQISPTITQNQNNQNPESPLTKIFFIAGGLVIILTGVFIASFLLKGKLAGYN